MKNEDLKQHSSAKSYCCISHVFNQTASNNPNKIAIIHARKYPKNIVGDETKTNIVNVNPPIYEGDQFFTFSELLSAINTLSFKLHHILNGGDDPSLIKPTSGNINLNVTTKLVGVYMVPSVEYVITVLSILKCGGAFLPLDPSWPKERILSIISSSNVDLVIGCLNSDQKSSAHLLDKSHWLVNCCKFPVLCISVDDILEQKCGKLDMVWPCESKGVREFSYLMYTSGSTGKPKGVCGTEEGILNRFLWMQEFYPIKGDEVLLFKTSISFVDHLQEFLAPLLAGSSLVVPPFDELKGNLFGFVDFMHDYSITRITAVPSLIRTLLPALESRYPEQVQSSLKLIVLSGEVFPISLWKMLSRIFPRTSILNIYGSTEVSGDCTYFDCKHLPKMLESEEISSVPIGNPISNCSIKLIEKDDVGDEGEICVTGLCLSRGYYSNGSIIPLSEEIREDFVSVNGCLSSRLYYRTGDFARKLPSNDLVFGGRKDRTIKVNGQRLALEEVEDTLRGHPDIADASVVFCNEQEDHAFLGAVLVLKDNTKSSQVLGAVRGWMMERLPSVMIPKEILCTEAIPMSSTGKVNYTSISALFDPVDDPNKGHVECSKTLEHIKETFCNSLGVTEIGDDDDFFAMGGDSLIAAHLAHKLGIDDMRLLYMFPSPSKLHTALLGKENLVIDQQVKWETLRKAQKEDLPHSSSSRSVKSRKHGEIMWNYSDELGKTKHLKVDAESHSNVKGITSLSSSFPWESHFMSDERAVSHSNKAVQSSKCELDHKWPETGGFTLPRNSKGSIWEIWKVPLNSCVDASPLLTFKDGQICIFIGSHSHKFVCINARNGSVIWEIELEGRIECSAMVDGDFSQIIVGCYQGKIYFIDIMNGNINWTFQTGGEVKSQPTIDKHRHLIWCGSHDHNLYGLDYRNYSCVYQFPCNGSIFGSPAIENARNMLYVGTTNGNLTAVTLKDSPFSIMWMIKLEAPIFGSVCISSNGNVLCCLVSGDVLSVNPEGGIVWRVKTDGPIFAGPCLSKALASQALICSRNGYIYSLKMENGRMLWKYNAGDPITAAAFVDEDVKLISDSGSPSERLVCVCSSSGRINLLQVSCVDDEDDIPENMVKNFAELDLPGDIFSSPVMVGGRIFVGCRDDFLHCFVVEAYLENDL